MQRWVMLLLVLCISLPAGSAAAQQDSIPDRPQKSEAVATVLAVFLPGAGHVYAGETGRGLLLAGATGLTFMYGFADGQCKRPYDDVRSCELEKNETLAAASFLTSLGLYAYSLWDAHRAVRRTNPQRNLGLGAFDVAPEVMFEHDPQGRTRIGLKLRAAGEVQ